MMRWDANDGDGVPVVVNVPNQASLLRTVREKLESGKGFSLATINLDHVVKLARDASFRQAYQQHTHVTADGNPIVWLSKLAGQKDVTLVPGSESIEPIAKLAADLDVPIGMFGSVETSLEVAADALCTMYPKLRVAMVRAPGLRFDPEGTEAQDAIVHIRESGAKVLFLALGAPKQERFAAFAQQHLPDVGFVSIGAGLDFISGQQKRAPKLVQRLALEWAWRMFSNPKRLFHRYLMCALVLPGLTRRAWIEGRS